MLHQESPSPSEFLSVSNFLVGGNQMELSISWGVHLLIWLCAAEREAILASMPRCDERGLTAVSAVPGVTIVGADEDLTVTQRSTRSLASS
jgi:hypothetical protein